MPNNGATATAIASGTADSEVRAAAAGLVLVGFSARECAGSAAAAEFNVRNGTTVAGAIVAHCSLAADGEKTITLPEGGIKCPDGIFLDRVSGTTEVVLYSYP